MLLKPILLTIACGFLSITCSALAMAEDRPLKILTAEDEPAVGAKVYIGLAAQLSLSSRGETTTPMGKENVDYAVRDEQGNGIDLSEIHVPSMGDDMGMGGGLGNGMADMEMEMMGGMMGPASRLPVDRASYYVVHPQHGFAFIPKSNRPPAELRLRPGQRLRIHVPKMYAADQFVVLACWMNRFADPVSDTHVSYDGGMGMDEADMDMGGGMGMAMGAGMEMGMGGGIGGGMGEGLGFVDDALGGIFNDWRLSTVVSHWMLADIKEEDDTNVSIATLTVPPGEVRLTLVPKFAITDPPLEPPQLEQLLYFGGPSRIVSTLSTKKDIQLNVSIPTHAVVDVELVGHTSETGLPDWTREENSIFLSAASARKGSKPQRLSNERDAILLAAGNRVSRSEAFLGRIAYPIGTNRYVAIGLPIDSYEVWSAKTGMLSQLTARVKQCRPQSYHGILQPLSVAPLETQGLTDSAGTSRQTASDTANRRFVYRVGPAYQDFDGQPRQLIDLAVPPGTASRSAAKSNPNYFDPFAGEADAFADDPFETASSKVESIPRTDKQKATAARLQNLRQRVERLEDELRKAKQILAELDKAERAR